MLLLALLMALSACSSARGDPGAAPPPAPADSAERAVEAGDLPRATPSTPTTSTIAGSAGPVPIRWLAVGDSFSSGEGLADATGRCSRSPSAFPGLARSALDAAAGEAGPMVERFVAAPCTGARITDWPEQLAEWDSDAPNLLSATFGGNDVGFVALMADCIGLDDSLELLGDPAEVDLGAAARLLLGRGCDRPEAAINAEIDQIQPALEELYATMAATVGDNGRVFVLGYPAPVADPAGWKVARCDGVSRDDGRLLRRAAERLNDTIEAATAVRPNVHFVDVAAIFDPHTRCSPEPWLYGLRDALEQVPDGSGTRLVVRARPFHPTPDGHEAMAELLLAAISTTSTSS